MTPSPKEVQAILDGAPKPDQPQPEEPVAIVDNGVLNWIAGRYTREGLLYTHPANLAALRKENENQKVVEAQYKAWVEKLNREAEHQANRIVQLEDELALLRSQRKKLLDILKLVCQSTTLNAPVAYARWSDALAIIKEIDGEP